MIVNPVGKLLAANVRVPTPPPALTVNEYGNCTVEDNPLVGVVKLNVVIAGDTINVNEPEVTVTWLVLSVTEKVTVEPAPVGVPVIAPVEELRDNPTGSDPLTT